MANITVKDTIVNAVLRSKVAYFSLLQKNYLARRKEEHEEKMARRKEKHEEKLAKLMEMQEEKLQWNEHQFQLEQQELAFQRTHDENRRKEFIENCWPLSLSPEDYLLMLKKWPNPSGLLPLNVIIPNQSFSLDTIDSFFHNIYNSNISPIFERSGDWKDDFMKRLNGNALIQNLWIVFKIPTILVLSEEFGNDFVIKVSYWGMLDQEPPSIFQTFSMNLKELGHFIKRENDKEDEIEVIFAKTKGECASWLINLTGCMIADMYFLSENDAQPKFSALLNKMPDFIADKKDQYAHYLEVKFMQLVVNERQFLKEWKANSIAKDETLNLLEREELKEDYQSKLLDVHKGKKFGYGCPALHAALVAKEFDKAGIGERAKIFIDWAIQYLDDNLDNGESIEAYKKTIEILKAIESETNNITIRIVSQIQEQINLFEQKLKREELRRLGIIAEIGKDWKVNLADGVDLEMMWVEAGNFKMGCEDDDSYSCEHPVHKVSLSKGYWIGKYQLTQEQWEAIDVERATHNYFYKGGKYPVECISWNEANQFCNILNEKWKDLLPKDYHFGLPTETQWEFASRGGIKSNGYKYSGSDNIDEVAWYYENSKIDRSYIRSLVETISPQYIFDRNRETYPIGQKKPNELGVYDMSGNVWEWCKDWYGEYPKEVVLDPQGPKEGSDRVVRGGSWDNPAVSCRLSFRSCFDPTKRNEYIGFRVALVPVQEDTDQS